MAVLAQRFGIPETPVWEPRYNIAPTQPIAAIRGFQSNDVPLSDDRGLAWLRWGLVPNWADDPKIGSRMINARSESVHEKPSFRTPFRKRRCVIPADGYYEWQTSAPVEGTQRAAAKRPFHFRRRDGEPFLMAGLWESRRRGDELLETCALLTVGANALAAQYHDRMPVILDEEGAHRWLDPDTPEARLRELLVPADPEPMVAVEVSTRVNKPSIDDPSLLE